VIVSKTNEILYMIYLWPSTINTKNICFIQILLLDWIIRVSWLFTEVEKYTIYLFISIQAICKDLDSQYELWLAWSRFPKTMLDIILYMIYLWPSTINTKNICFIQILLLDWIIRVSWFIQYFNIQWRQI
jgi:hypothetical protein